MESRNKKGPDDLAFGSSQSGKFMKIVQMYPFGFHSLYIGLKAPQKQKRFEEDGKSIQKS